MKPEFPTDPVFGIVRVSVSWGIAAHLLRQPARMYYRTLCGRRFYIGDHNPEAARSKPLCGRCRIVAEARR